MNDGTKFAVAILALFGSMLCFYFAFHPNGVEDVAGTGSVGTASGALRVLIKGFQSTAGETTTGTGGSQT
jgi:hypothetical protein